MGWQRTDDLDGSPAEQHTFGLDGKAYTIDLGEANAAKLLKLLQPFLTVAQVFAEMPEPPEVNGPVTTDTLTPAPEPVSAPTKVKRRGGGKTSVAAPQSTVRQWANENGFAVSAKGRIPDAVMAAYTLAH